MTEKRATLEVIAPTIEEAIAKGLADLGLPEDAVVVEVLDQGSRGLFGLGSRQARVRLAVKPQSAVGVQVTSTIESDNKPFLADTLTIKPEESLVKEADIVDQPETSGREVSEEVIRPSKAALEKDLELHVARETLIELLEKMKIRAQVTAHFGEVDEERGRAPIMIDVRGDDLSILIGRRAEVLNALQYIAGLIISKELGRSVSLVVDVEGYRVRREGQLRQLARRMAEQAIKTGRQQVLEPMPANERRIIHMELREYPGVRTESVGEDPRRKVTIIPTS